VRRMRHRQIGQIAAAASLLWACASHADTIYDCADASGRQVLQNMPCQSQVEVWVQKDGHLVRGSVPATPAPAPAVSPATFASSAPALVAPESDFTPPANADRPAATPAAAAAPADFDAMTSAQSAASADDTAAQVTEPSLGMSQAQVRAMLGEPTAITREESVQGVIVTWSYGDSRLLQFDVNGRLMSK